MAAKELMFNTDARSKLKKGVDALAKEIGSTVGLDRLRGIHLNDCLKDFGSRVDRHWHIGEGKIGEDGFRAAESALARELGAREGLVIATGGGTMMRPENRVALGENGLIVCLTCAAEEILRRLDGDTTRPMLAAPDKMERVKELLDIRMPVYVSLPVVVDTTGRSVAEVAEVVMTAYRNAQCKPSTST